MRIKSARPAFPVDKYTVKRYMNFYQIFLSESWLSGCYPVPCFKLEKNRSEKKGPFKNQVNFTQNIYPRPAIVLRYDWKIPLILGSQISNYNIDSTSIKFQWP